MTHNHSFEALMDFLDYLGKKGLMNKNTVVSRKAACNKMLSALDQDELIDLRKLDLDVVAQRFSNLQGGEYAPKSLRVYKSRVRSSLDDFFRFKENPANFAVGTKPRKRLPKHVNTSSASSQVEVGAAPPLYKEAEKQTPTIDVPIALSAGRIVQLNGLPINMTKAEAQKIANVVMAMATVEE